MHPVSRSRQAGGRLGSNDSAGHAAGRRLGASRTGRHSQRSLLIEAVRRQSLEMPPDRELTDQQIESLARWIDGGAPWPEGPPLRPVSEILEQDRQWWCIQPIADPHPPAVEDQGWCRNEIDRFILARLQAAGLKPAPAAGRLQLQRRLHFGLTGLPPNWQAELDTETAADSGWYEQLLEQLLNDPGYGENQARYWLDLVRYADTDGYRADGPRPAAHQYRDYVIRSFNEDKPYDRFVMEQLAGDEIDPGNAQAVIGTMFLRHWIYEHNQRDVEGQWQEVLDDITETTADAFLALGLKCARCHDHKFDPLLQRDFFQLQACFAPLLPREDFPVASVETRQRYNQQFEIWEQATDAPAPANCTPSNIRCCSSMPRGRL